MPLLLCHIRSAPVLSHFKGICFVFYSYTIVQYESGQVKVSKARQLIDLVDWNINFYKIEK
jgi:hypothetical protein